MRTIPMLACAALLAFPVDAQERGGRNRGRGGFGINAEVLANLVKKYDKNDDGKIDRKEYPRGDAAFGNLDKDGNGTIEEKDLEARGGGRARGNRGGARSGERPARPKVPAVGEVAPDFDLPLADHVAKSDTDADAKTDAKTVAKKVEKTVKLSSFKGDKPVALIFGSYT